MQIAYVCSFVCLVLVGVSVADLSGPHPVVDRMDDVPVGAPGSSQAGVATRADDLSYMSPYAPVSAFPYSEVRLPTSVRPHGYAVRMRCDLPAFSFSGHVTMYARVYAKTDFVVFHSKMLQLKGKPKVKVNRRLVDVVKFVVSDKQQQVLIDSCEYAGYF